MMRRAFAVFLAALAAACLGACLLPGLGSITVGDHDGGGGGSSLKTPGSACGADSECSSGQCDKTCNQDLCDTGWCTGGSCSCGQAQCSGVASSDCPSGWVCQYFAPDSVSQFFGSNGGNACVATCGACPPNESCAPGQPAGSRCAAGTPLPTVSIDDGSDSAYRTVPSGQPVQLHAAASSATGAITSFTWTFSGAPDDTGADVTHVFATTGYQQVTVTVVDVMHARAQASTQVYVCGPAGSACSSGTNACCGSCNVTADGGACM